MKAHDLGSFAYQLVQCALSHVVVDGSLWEMMLLLLLMLTMTMHLRSVPQLLSFPMLSSYPSLGRRLLRRQRRRQKEARTGNSLIPLMGRTSCRTASHCPPHPQERDLHAEMTRDDQTRSGWTEVWGGSKREQESPNGLMTMRIELLPHTWETSSIELAQMSTPRPGKRAKAREIDAGGVLGSKQMPCRGPFGSDHCKGVVVALSGRRVILAFGYGPGFYSGQGSHPAAARTSSERLVSLG